MYTLSTLEAVILFFSGEFDIKKTVLMLFILIWLIALYQWSNKSDQYQLSPLWEAMDYEKMKWQKKTRITGYVHYYCQHDIYGILNYIIMLLIALYPITTVFNGVKTSKTL